VASTEGQTGLIFLLPIYPPILAVQRGSGVDSGRQVIDRVAWYAGLGRRAARSSLVTKMQPNTSIACSLTHLRQLIWLAAAAAAAAANW